MDNGSPSGSASAPRWAIDSETLLEAAGLLNSSLEKEEVLGTLSRQFLRIAAADWVLVTEVPEGSNDHCLVLAGAGHDPSALGLVFGRSLPLSRYPALRQAVESQVPVWSDGGDSYPSGRSAAVAVLTVPLVFRDTVLGILLAGWSTPLESPGAAEFRLIQGLANQAATALENARLFASAERRAAQVTALFEIGRDISANLALSQILNSIVQKAQQLLVSDTSFLALLSPDGQELEMTSWVGLRTEAMRKLRLRREQGLAGLVVRSGEPVIVEGYTPELSLRDWPREAVRQEGLISQIAVPLGNGKDLLGVLYIGNRHPSRFLPEDAQLLMTFAKQATIAIQNARLYEEALAQREEAEAGRRRLQVIIESMPEGIVIVEGPNAVVSTVNEAGKTILGPGIVAGSQLEPGPAPLGMFTPRGDPFPWDRFPLIRALLLGETCLGEEAAVHRPDGTVLSVLTNCAPFRDPEGTVSGAVAIFQDVSRAKEAEQLKDEFVSLVSHELRTPLTSIKGAARTLIRHHETLDTETRMELLKDVDEESDRLYRLVENLLDFSRSEAGVLRLATEPVQIGKLAARVVEEVGLRAPDHSFTLEVHPGLPLAEADPLRAEQVLRNLLDNAVKYSPEGGAITVAVRSDHGMIRVSVSDEGIGISAEDRERVFGRFQRAVEGAGIRASGVGLGLAICRRLVEAHGGRIWVEGRMGPGTTITFTLPIVEEEWGQ